MRSGGARGGCGRERSGAPGVPAAGAAGSGGGKAAGDRSAPGFCLKRQLPRLHPGNNAERVDTAHLWLGGLRVRGVESRIDL